MFGKAHPTSVPRSFHVWALQKQSPRKGMSCLLWALGKSREVYRNIPSPTQGALSQYFVQESLDNFSTEAAVTTPLHNLRSMNTLPSPMVTPISSLEKGHGLDYIRDTGVTDHIQMSPFLTDWFLLKLSESQRFPSAEHRYFLNHKLAILCSHCNHSQLFCSRDFLSSYQTSSSH